MSSEGETVATVPYTLHSSGEDYLKTILILQGKNGYVRSMDIVKYLHLSKPSVSKAMRLLRDSGYIEMNEDKRIILTEAGQTVAEQVYEKHSIIKACLIRIGVDADIADKDACQMEHIVSQETIVQMKAFPAARTDEKRRRSGETCFFAHTPGRVPGKT